MELRPGLRLESTTCETQVVVVKAPADTDVDVRCGGRPMVEPDSDGREEPTGAGGPTLLGKRYQLEALGVEVLCTRGGAGGLSIGDRPLEVKSAKPLPASD